MKRLHRKRLIAAICILTCLGLAARSDDYFKVQGDVMKCSPPKFMLVSEVDLEAQTLTGLSTIQRHKPKPVVIAFHMTFKLSDIKVTNARRTAVDESNLNELKGKLVVLSEGKEPLSAAYLSLFREDTIVVSVSPGSE